MEKEIILEADIKIVKLISEVLEKVDNSDVVIMVTNDTGYVEYIVDIFLGHILVSAPEFPVTVDEVRESYKCPQCGVPHVGDFITMKLPDYY